MEKSFAIIESGSEETFSLAASWDKNGNPVVEGFHRLISSGMSDGSVSEIYPAAEHIRTLLSGLSKKTGVTFHEVYAGISSPSVEMSASSGSILISKYGREITSRDVKKCVEIGSLARIPLDREVLHKSIMGFSVDGERMIRDPEGLEAVKLGVEVNIVTIGVTSIRNFSKTIAQAGYIPSGFFFSPLACSSRIMTEEDKMDRTVFLSPRAKKTEVLLFNSGSLQNCIVFDRSICEKQSNMSGEGELGEYGWFFNTLLSMRGWSDMRRIVISGTKEVSEDFLHLAEKNFSLPIRVGLPLPRAIEELPEDGASYASVLGILDQVVNSRVKQTVEKNPIKRALNSMAGALDEYF